MTQEEKQLLLQDLSARLPYGVMIQIPELFYPQRKVTEKLVSINDLWHFNDNGTYIENVRPYLRSISSMTEDEFYKLKEYSGLTYDQLDLASFQNGTYKCLDFYLNEVPSGAVIRVFDWLNKHHFDYRDMIQMGLAIAVTPENNPYEI